MSKDRTDDQFAEEPLRPEDEGSKGPARRKRFDDDDRPVPKKNNTLLIVLLVVVLGGGCCGVVIVGFVMPGIQKAAEHTQYIKQIGLAYHGYLSAYNKPPQKAADLADFVERNPKIMALLNNGSVVFIYGISPNDMMATGIDRTVLAYEKEVPEKGGIVLFGDTHVETVTPAEFANLPKAQKGMMK